MSPSDRLAAAQLSNMEGTPEYAAKQARAEAASKAAQGTGENEGAQSARATSQGTAGKDSGNF